MLFFQTCSQYSVKNLSFSPRAHKSGFYPLFIQVTLLMNDKLPKDYKFDNLVNLLWCNSHLVVFCLLLLHTILHNDQTPVFITFFLVFPNIYQVVVFCCFSDHNSGVVLSWILLVVSSFLIYGAHNQLECQKSAFILLFWYFSSIAEAICTSRRGYMHRIAEAIY